MTHVDKAHNGVARVPLRTNLIPKLVKWPAAPVEFVPTISPHTKDRDLRGTEESAQLDELFEERAAIREFDGKLNRIDAELLAAHDCKRTCE